MINIQDEVQKIHRKYGVTEMANYKIQQLCELYAKEYHDEQGRLLVPETMPRMTRLELVTDGPLWDSWVTCCCRRVPITDEKYCHYCGAEIIFDKEDLK